MSSFLHGAAFFSRIYPIRLEETDLNGCSLQYVEWGIERSLFDPGPCISPRKYRVLDQRLLLQIEAVLFGGGYGH